MVDRKVESSSSPLAATREKTASPREVRFNRILDRIDELASSVQSDAELLAMVEDKNADFRGQAFRLEGLLKLYKHALGEDSEKIIKDVKALEDALGKYSETREAIDFAEQVKAPSQLTIFLKQRRASASRQLVFFLKKEKWVGATPSKVVKLKHDLAKLDWPKDSEDADYFRKRLAHEYKKISEKDYPRTRSNDSIGAIYDQMENWTHELRRDYRMPNIMMGAADGLVQRDDKHCSIPKYSNLLNSPIAKMPYVVLPHNPLIKKPIFVEGCLFLAFASKIFELGEIKDRGAGVIFLAKGLLDSKMEQTEEAALAKALSLVKPSFDFDRDVFAKTAEIERDTELSVNWSL